MISANCVGMQFGGYRALQNVSIDFYDGQVTSIIGPNGAGKSTLLNILSGAFRATEGQVLFQGRDISKLGQHKYARLGIARSFQMTNVFPKLTVLENVRVAVQAMQVRYNLFSDRRRYQSTVESADQLLTRVGLKARRRLASQLGHGEQRALEIAIALACDPKLLLLDEPTAGMSPEETIEMMNLIASLARDRTVILVEHKMKLILQISDRIVVLHHGEVIADGSPEAIRGDSEVRRVYLGQNELSD